MPDNTITAEEMRDRNIAFLRALVPGLEPTEEFENYEKDTPMVKEYTQIAQRAELKLSVFEESYNDSATVQVNFENDQKTCTIQFNMQMTLPRDLHL